MSAPNTPSLFSGPHERVQLANDLRNHMEKILGGISSNEMSIGYIINRRHWIGELDAAISDLSRLSRLVSAALTRERNAINTAVALPLDVIVEILRHGGLQTTMAASRVCHRWRVTAISHPGLWTSIDMAHPLFSKNSFRLQLSRSANLPLDFNFRILEDMDQFYNVDVPHDVESLLQRARSISNLSTKTIYTIEAEKLESLHVIMDPRPSNARPLLGSTPKLRHLAVDCVGGRFINTPHITFITPESYNNILTLHLRGGADSARLVVNTLTSLPRLQEVLLSKIGQESPFRTILPHMLTDNVDNPVLLRALKLLVLADLSSFFLYSFLSVINIPPTANMRIDNWPIQVSPSIPHDRLRCDAKAAYIQSVTSGDSKNTIYYEHESSISQITIEKATKGSYSIRLVTEVIPVTALETLTWLTGGPHPDFVWKGLDSLRNLSFTFSPGISDGYPVTLQSVLSNELIEHCPRLEYIGIILKYASITGTSLHSHIRFKDRAESAIPYFLESWMELYNNKFGTIRVQDEIKPSRWEICIPTFEYLIEEFEIGHVSLELPSKFGSKSISALEERQFQPEVDPKSTSNPI